MVAIGRCLWWVYRKTLMLAIGSARVGMQTDADAGYGQVLRMGIQTDADAGDEQVLRMLTLAMGGGQGWVYMCIFMLLVIHALLHYL